jgi:hypothetical protein
MRQPPAREALIPVNTIDHTGDHQLAVLGRQRNPAWGLLYSRYHPILGVRSAPAGGVGATTNLTRGQRTHNPASSKKRESVGSANSIFQESGQKFLQHSYRLAGGKMRSANPDEGGHDEAPRRRRTSSRHFPPLIYGESPQPQPARRDLPSQFRRVTPQENCNPPCQRSPAWVRLYRLFTRRGWPVESDRYRKPRTK